jgi:murein L,D-transpeptidase YafK
MRSLIVILMFACAAHANVCGASTEVVVEAKRHTLTLCERGAPSGSFSVSLGRGGVGKSKDGDNKTPLGVYSLGKPRASATYGTFIPVAYPTPAQTAAGATGGDIGVHGPRRDKRWLGRLARLADWTRGCVAVATDDEIGVIAAWIRAHPSALLRII